MCASGCVRVGVCEGVQMYAYIHARMMFFLCVCECVCVCVYAQKRSNATALNSPLNRLFSSLQFVVGGKRSIVSKRPFDPSLLLPPVLLFLLFLFLLLLLLSPSFLLLLFLFISSSPLSTDNSSSPCRQTSAVFRQHVMSDER